MQTEVPNESIYLESQSRLCFECLDSPQHRRTQAHTAEPSLHAKRGRAHHIYSPTQSSRQPDEGEAAILQFNDRLQITSEEARQKREWTA